MYWKGFAGMPVDTTRVTGSAACAEATAGTATRVSAGTTGGGGATGAIGTVTDTGALVSPSLSDTVTTNVPVAPAAGLAAVMLNTATPPTATLLVASTLKPAGTCRLTVSVSPASVVLTLTVSCCVPES